MISRLTDQKGFDLIAAAADELMALDATWVMLGSGDRAYEDLWRILAARYPQRVSATIGFDERLAHRIEAGADMFLMPSQFRALRPEPDVQPALRHASDRPGDRRPGGYRHGRRRNRAAMASNSADYSPSALVRPSGGRWSSSANPRNGRRSSRTA